jgi:hypothetical protein
MTIEICEPFAVADTFCGQLVRIENLGPVRRLVFATMEPHSCGGPSLAVVAKLIIPAEMLLDVAQTILADRPEATAFISIPSNAVAN